MTSLDRRQFLKTSTQLAASAWAALRGAATAAARPARAWKKAVGIAMIGVPGSLLDRLRAVRECGFDGVELNSPSDLDADELSRALEQTGLAVSEVVDSVHWSQRLTDADESVRKRGREALITAIKDSARYGATSVLLVPGVVDKNVAYDTAWNRSIAEIKQVLPLAEQSKVTITIENVWNDFLLSPLEAAHYVDEFNSPWVGFHFDVGNAVNYGYPEQWIHILGARIKKLHIKEFSRKKRNDEGLWKGFDVELGEGDCDWPAITAALDDVGYRGWATAEVGGGDVARLKDIAARMNRILGLS